MTDSNSDKAKELWILRLSPCAAGQRIPAALALPEDVDVAKEEAAKDSSWRNFWSKSELDLMTGSSELHDPEAVPYTHLTLPTKASV